MSRISGPCFGLCLAFALSACGDPLRGIPRLSEVAGQDEAVAVALAAQGVQEPEPPEGGLFGFLRPSAAPSEAAQEDSAQTDTEIQDIAEADLPDAEDPEPRRAGLFGLFGGSRNAQTSEDPSDIEPTLASAPDHANVSESQSEVTSTEQATGPDAATVSPDVLLPIGEIGRVCGLRTRDAGTKIESVIGLNLYDTNPNRTAPRSFYLTGFPDGCARQFTGVLVLAGDIGTHEVVRYASHNDRIDYSETDLAYEEIKSRFCRVDARQPCGNRLEALGRKTMFFTVYPKFGGAAEWVEILIHNREVVAIDWKG